MTVPRCQLCYLIVFLLSNVVKSFLPVPLIPRHRLALRRRSAALFSAISNNEEAALSSEKYAAAVRSESEKSRLEVSKVLKSITAGGSCEEFFEHTWQKSSRIFRANSQQASDRKCSEQERVWDDARVDEDPLRELVQMGLDGVVSLLSEARGCFDNPNGEWRMLLPLVYRQRQMLQLPELREDYGNSLFAAYLDGCSVVLNHADELCPFIASVCLDLQKSFPHVYANAYLTPPASQAVPAHADDRDVFIIQLLGRKHWKVYENVPITYPYAHEQVGKNGLSIPEEVLEGPLAVDSILEPGDVLYIPRGEVHEAYTDASEPSFHVTIALPTFDWALTGILTSAVRHTLDGVNEYRMAVPPSFGMKDIDSIPVDDVSALEKQVQDALELVKKRITTEAISHNLRHKHEMHNQRALPKRLARINQARIRANADVSPDKPNVVGKAAAETITSDSYVRAIMREEEINLGDGPPLPEVRVRKETRDSVLKMLEKLKTDPSNASCQVSKLPSLLEEPCELLCDLTLLSCVRTNVECGNLELVR